MIILTQFYRILSKFILLSCFRLRICILYVRAFVNAQVFHRLLVPWRPQFFQRKISCHIFVFCQRHVCHQLIFIIQLSHLPDLAKSHNLRSLQTSDIQVNLHTSSIGYNFLQSFYRPAHNTILTLKICSDAFLPPIFEEVAMKFSKKISQNGLIRTLLKGLIKINKFSPPLLEINILQDVIFEIFRNSQTF